MKTDTKLSRRRFLKLASTATTTTLWSKETLLFGQTTFSYDILIRGGDVIDPSQSLRGKRDLLVHDGRVVRIEPEIAGVSAKQVIDAKGKLVVPGLIDLHGHIGLKGESLGLPVDSLMAFTGVTTCVSAGDKGYQDFESFRSSILSPLKTRTFAFLNISRLGLTKWPEPELLDINNASVDKAVEMFSAHPNTLIGLKVRESRHIVGENGLEPLRRAIAAAEKVGPTTRVMCHIGKAPGQLSALLDLLRPGDILTHAYSGSGNNTVQNGRVLPAALAAKGRGVIIDVGHGKGSFDYTIAEAAIAQGLLPDTLSGDLHVPSIKSQGKPYLPWVMSKFLHLGFTLEQVIAMTTINPARIIGRIGGLGTLKVGAPADVTVLESVGQECAFWDTKNHRRTGERFLRPVVVIRDGQIAAQSSGTTTPYP